MTRLFALAVLALTFVLSACDQPAVHGPGPSTADPGCVQACVDARQMEARAPELIRADCEKECAANPGAYPR
jgi:hypothetical protein